MAQCSTAQTDSVTLNGLFRILVVEDEPDIRDFIAEAIACVPLCSVAKAADVSAARRYFDHGKAPHVCVLDLGLPGPEEGISIVNDFAGVTSIIVVTGQRSAQLGARVVTLGARMVVDKAGLALETLVRLVLAEATRRMMLGFCGTNRFLFRAVEILIERNPSSVTAWAACCAVDESYLRKNLHEEGLRTRHVLQAYRLLSELADMYCRPGAHVNPSLMQSRAVSLLAQSHSAVRALLLREDTSCASRDRRLGSGCTCHPPT